MDRPIEGTEPWRSAAQSLVDEHKATLTHYRTGMRGSAYTKDREFSAPMPRTAKSFSIFAHEVGHIALHQTHTLPRWREEIEAWNFALEAFDRYDLKGRYKVVKWCEPEIVYAIDKALRRGAKDVLTTLRKEYPYWSRRLSGRW